MVVLPEYATPETFPAGSGLPLLSNGDTATFVNGPFIDPDEGRHTFNHDLTSKRPRPAVPVQRRG